MMLLQSKKWKKWISIPLMISITFIGHKGVTTTPLSKRRTNRSTKSSPQFSVTLVQNKRGTRPMPINRNKKGSMDLQGLYCISPFRWPRRLKGESRQDPFYVFVVHAAQKLNRMSENLRQFNDLGNKFVNTQQQTNWPKLLEA